MEVTTAALSITPNDTSETGDFEDTVTVVNAETGDTLLALKVSSLLRRHQLRS